MKYLNKNEREEIKWKQALAINSWRPLINSPQLLYWWQRGHERSIVPIARYISHKNGGHKFCGENCASFDKLFKKLQHLELLKILIIIERERERTTGQHA